SLTGSVATGPSLAPQPRRKHARAGFSLMDRQRGADAHEPRQLHYCGVPNANAAMRDVPRDQAWSVGAVDADVPAAGPVGQDCRAGARAECNWAINGIVEAAHPLGDVELAARRRPVRLAHAD